MNQIELTRVARCQKTRKIHIIKKQYQYDYFCFIQFYNYNRENIYNNCENNSLFSPCLTHNCWIP